MRTLCLHLPKNERASVAETFLSFSPKVYYRSPGLVFVDVATAAKAFGSEQKMFNELHAVAQDFYPGSVAAVADTPATAQLMSRMRPSHIVAPQNEREELRSIPLNSLVHLEGLFAWRTTREIENVIDFFYSLGLKQLGDLQRFSMQSLGERFGELGTIVWKRLNGRDKQIISPLLTSDPLSEHIHFDVAVTMMPLLFRAIESRLKALFARMNGRKENLGKLLVHFYCEYSDRYHLIEYSPQNPHSDFLKALRALESKLGEMELENPVRQISLEIISARVVSSVGLGPERTTLTSGFLSAAFENQDEDFLTSSDDSIHIGGKILRFQATQSSNGLNFHSDSPHWLSEPEPLSDFARSRLRSIQPYTAKDIDETRGCQYYVARTPEGKSVLLFYDKVADQYFVRGSAGC